ncbi:MAG: hypothetical protein JRJ03_00175 [Deltaproteobacteria bacterium]|nr:hypothetical protein [Deltaproteobacteria bacterium]
MKTKLSYFLQLKPNIFLYQRLGWRIAFYYMLFLGHLYFFLNRKEKWKITKSLEGLYGDNKGSDEIKAITKRVFLGILSHYYEKVFNAYVKIEELKSFFNSSIEANSLIKLDKALKQGKGVLFVTGHYGGIEYIPIFLALKHYPISVVAKFATEQLKSTLYERTKDLGLKIIDANQQSSILGAIIQELRSNRIVFFECDEIEEWKPSQKERMFFLRKMVGVDRTISIIQKRTRAEIIFGILHRYSIRKYRLIVRNWQDMVSVMSDVPPSIGAVLLRYLERYIYSYPEEWYQWKNFAAIGTPTPAYRKMPGAVPVLPRPVLS